MEIQQLRYFTSVAKHRNFTRAAAACHVSQPSLSAQVKKLESELGAPLFHRQGRTTLLTEAGESLLVKAKGILSLHQSATQEIRDRLQGGGVAKFGSILTLAPYLIDDFVGNPRFAEMPPNTFEENLTENLLISLVEGQLDFAILATPVTEPNLLSKMIVPEPFMLVCSESNPLAEEADLDLDKVFAQNFLPLSNIHCAGKQISEFCQINRRKPETNFRGAQVSTILRLVSANQGVTILPRIATRRLPYSNLTCRPLEGGKLQRTISIVQHQDRFLNDASRQWIKALEEHLRADLRSPRDTQ